MKAISLSIFYVTLRKLTNKIFSKKYNNFISQIKLSTKAFDYVFNDFLQDIYRIKMFTLQDQIKTINFLVN